MRQLLNAVLVAVAAFTTSLPLAGPTLAECAFLDPWPPFEQVAPRAATVIAGQVVEDRDPNSHGYLKKFGFRVDEVFRGDAQPGSIIEVAFLPPGPPGRCPDTYLRPLLGDVVAIAIDAQDGGISYNSAAWLKGEPDAMQHGLGTITRRGLRALFEIPPTDTANQVMRDTSDDLPLAIWVGLLAGLAVLAGLGGPWSAGARPPPRRPQIQVTFTDAD